MGASSASWNLTDRLRFLPPLFASPLPPREELLPLVGEFDVESSD